MMKSTNSRNEAFCGRQYHVLMTVSHHHVANGGWHEPNTTASKTE